MSRFLFSIHDVLTTIEAAKMWCKEESTIKKACQMNRFTNYEARKEDSGKNGRWLISKFAMERLYGKLKDELGNEGAYEKNMLENEKWQFYLLINKNLANLRVWRNKLFFKHAAFQLKFDEDTKKREEFYKDQGELFLYMRDNFLQIILEAQAFLPDELIDKLMEYRDVTFDCLTHFWIEPRRNKVDFFERQIVEMIKKTVQENMGHSERV